MGSTKNKLAALLPGLELPGGGVDDEGAMG